MFGDGGERTLMDDAAEIGMLGIGLGFAGAMLSPVREESFDEQTGRYRQEDGTMARGSPPSDYDQEIRGFRARDGEFKSRSKDLGEGTPYDDDGMAMGGDVQYQGDAFGFPTTDDEKRMPRLFDY